jgi:hypothetical protein
VYVVAGSSSEVRPANLNHPTMEIGLLQLGSLVLDVDGDTLTATFVNSQVQTTDGFRVVKGPACPAAPRTGCTVAGRGSLLLKNDPDDSRDALVWRWKGGAYNPLEVGTPDGQTDLAVCLHDQNGRLLGGTLPRADARWTSRSGEYVYSDKTAAHLGMRTVRMRFAGRVLVKGRGAGLAVPTLPAALPVTAQVVNLDNGACWESKFPTARLNGPTKLLLR